MDFSNIILVYTTVGTNADAKDLAKKMIESKCAVCVNIMAPHRSCYFDNGEMVEVEEVGMLIKILEDYYEVAYDAIKGWHPYKIPALLAWPVEPNKAYSMWAHHQTAMKA